MSRSVSKVDSGGHAPGDDVAHVLLRDHRGCPHSYLLMKSPSTRSGMCSVLEKHSVRRTRRLIRVCRLLCVRSIFCVCSLPTWCCSALRCRIGFQMGRDPSFPVRLPAEQDVMSPYVNGYIFRAEAAVDV